MTSSPSGAKLTRGRYGLRAGALMVMAVVLAACVTDNIEMQSAGPETTAPKVFTGKTAPLSPLLVVVRYPSMVGPGLSTRYNETYPGFGFPNPNTRHPDAVGDAVTKTGYYVIEFYDLLRRRLPPNTVALQPLFLGQLPGGEIALTPSMGLPPAVLYVDFFAYVYPSRFAKAVSNTSGKFLSPIWSLHTAAEAAPETKGALAGTDGFGPGAKPDKIFGSSGGLSYTIADRLNGVPVGQEIRVSSRLPLRLGEYLELPQIRHEMDEDAMARQAKVPGGMLGAPPSARALNAFVDVVIDALNAVDHAKATKRATGLYIGEFDSELVTEFMEDRLRPESRTRLELVREILAAERTFLARHDEKFIKSVYMSGFGDSVRQTLLAEISQESNWWSQSLLGSFSMLAAGVASGATTGQYLSPGVFSAYQASLDSQQRLQAAFQDHFGGVLNEQVQFSITTVGGAVNISASKLAELREGGKKIYDQVTRR